MTPKLPILAMAALALSACTAMRLIHSAKLKAPRVTFVALIAGNPTAGKAAMRSLRKMFYSG